MKNKCSEFTEEIFDDYVFSRLDENNMKKIEKHVFQCESCFQKLEIRKEIFLAFSTDKKLRSENISKEKIISASERRRLRREKLVINEKRKGSY